MQNIGAVAWRWMRGEYFWSGDAVDRAEDGGEAKQERTVDWEGETRSGAPERGRRVAGLLSGGEFSRRFDGAATREAEGN